MHRLHGVALAVVKGGLGKVEKVELQMVISSFDDWLADPSCQVLKTSFYP